MQVRFEQVTKRFGDLVALDRLDLIVKAGECLCLLGPSGCGKTTALRILAGLERASGGHVYIGDEKVDFLPPRNRDVAMVFQNYALYPHMSVYDNLAFPLLARKMSPDEIRQRVNTVAEMLRISHLLGRFPKQLSGGQAQRVALGRAIIRRPRVFLMDEPLSNIDAKLRVEMRVELEELHRHLGVTTIYVTHDQEEAMTLGERLAVMNHGVLQQVGTPEEIYHHPVNKFVAGFIGSPTINFVDGTLECEGGEWVVRTPDLVYRLGNIGVNGCILKSGGRHHQVTMGIRPEHMWLCSEGYQAQVKLVESLGRELRVYLSTGKNTLVTILNTHSGGPKAGETVAFDFDKSRVHLFDRDTGVRISG